MPRQTEVITPMIHVEYMITEVIMRKYDPHKWWVVWYNSDSLASAGMKEFDSFREATDWDVKNPPREIQDGVYDRSTIVYSGEK